MKNTPLKLGLPVLVRWRDSSFFHGWRYENAPPFLPEICSIGYITHIDDNLIEIASTRIGGNGKNQNVLNPLAIPIGAIETAEIIEGLDGN